MILVTGGSGFVARHLVRRCAVEGRPVRVLSRREAPASLPSGAGWVRADLTDVSALRAALSGVDAVVHTAALLATSGPQESELRRANVEVTTTLATLARDAGVSRFVHLSTGGVYGGAYGPPHTETDATAPDNAYARTKLEAEHAVTGAFGGPQAGWTILRPPGLYAADRPETAAFVRQVATRALWLHGPTRVIVQPTHVDDVVRATLAVLDRSDCGGEVFNVGGAQAVEYQELIGMVAARLGRRALQLSAPRLRARGGRLAIDKARSRLGFEPTPLAAGLDATVAALRTERAS